MNTLLDRLGAVLAEEAVAACRADGDEAREIAGKVRRGITQSVEATVRACGPAPSTQEGDPPYRQE